MKKKTILIASTNQAKVAEIRANFNDLPYRLISLNNLKKNIPEPDEPFDTTYFNALKKAEYYALKTGHITIAEDTALFVDSLNGLPGIKAKRYGKTAAMRNQKLVDALKGKKKAARRAHFQTSICIFDPRDKSANIFDGEAQGIIAEKIHPKHREGMGYDAVFYYPPLKKYFADLTIEEKNNISHRGQALRELKYYLNKLNQAPQYLVPVSVIIKDKKVLLLKRRDPRQDFNDLWEFPGGGVEYGETMEECLKRETYEETGYRVEVVRQLPKFFTAVRNKKDGNYQVFTILFICKIKSGNLKINPSEHSSFGWYTYKEMMRQNLIPLNRKTILNQENKEILLKYID